MGKVSGDRKWPFDRVEEEWHRGGSHSRGTDIGTHVHVGHLAASVLFRFSSGTGRRGTGLSDSPGASCISPPKIYFRIAKTAGPPPSFLVSSFA